MKNRYTRAATAMLALLLALAVGGCGAKAKELDIDAFCTKVLETVQYDDQLAPLSENTIGDFYAIPFEGLEDYAVYVSGTMATSNELTVMKLKDEQAVESAKKVIEQRLQDQINNYENYVPEELHRLEQALTVTEGSYLLFSVSQDNDTVRKLFADSFQ